MAIPFKVGQRYRNREGEYEVISIDGATMTMRFTDGRTVRSAVDLQARIWERIREEEDFGAVDVEIGDEAYGSEERKTEEVRDLVARALRTIPQPWPPDVTDQVCLAIERRADWLAEYKRLVADLGELSVNSSIGAHAKDLTNMENTGRTATAKSRLIKGYSILAPSQR